MTRDNVERKQARTEDERIEDEDDEFIEEEEEGKSSIFLFCNHVTYPNLNRLQKLYGYSILFQETKKTMMILFTILKIFLWDGMESRFLIGCTNCMAWTLITSVKYVAIKLIVVPKHSRDTFLNGVTLMAWDVSVRIVPVYFSLFYVKFLGIPNTAHFANVTEIEDALALWAKLKEQKAHERQSCKMNLWFYEIEQYSRLNSPGGQNRDFWVGVKSSGFQKNHSRWKIIIVPRILLTSLSPS